MRGTLFTLIFILASIAFASGGLPEKAAGVFRPTYSKRSLGVTVFNKAPSHPRYGQPFDFIKFGELPTVSELTLEYDPATFKGTLTGGLWAKTRQCTAKSKVDSLECEVIPEAKTELTPLCNEGKYRQEHFSFDGERSQFTYSIFNYYAFEGDCTKYKWQLADDIKSGKSAPHWKALADTEAIANLDNIEDLGIIIDAYTAEKR